MKFAPSKSKRPQVGKSGGNPRPRNESADSVTMALAIPRVADTMIGLRMLGKICSIMIREEDTPTLLAARTNSRSFTTRVSPRTIRAVCIQLVIPITKTISKKMPVSGPNAARRASLNNMMITSSSGSSGRARNKSVIRMSGPSRGLKKPASTPTTVPRTNESSIAVTPTARATLPPASTWTSISRPRLSVPNGCDQDTPKFFCPISRS